MNPISRITMYDALTMLASGVILSALFVSFPKDGTCYSVLFWVVCYLIGMVYHRIVEYFYRKDRNREDLLEESFKRIQNKYPCKLSGFYSEQRYYTAYYCLMKRNCLGNIPVLEAQVAFIRNIIWILFGYGVFLLMERYSRDINLCFGCYLHYNKEFYEAIMNLFGGCLWIACSFFVGLACCLMKCCMVAQKKIHELVWEGYAFLEETKNE